MVELWFAIASVTVAMFVALDGFDFGAGVLHLFVARTDRERRQVMSAIGPFWDGNEVWLLASAGVLFIAFPKILASGLSGFYFAIFLVLWMLILRGISLEVRSHVEHPLWKSAWDVIFAASSTAMPILLGAALGNLLRGLPLDEHGWFSLGLFTNFTATGDVGILDWYTILVGVFATAALTTHGGTFLAWKTDGAVRARARTAAARCALGTAVLWPLVTAGTAVVNRPMYLGLQSRPLAWACLAVTIAGATMVATGLRRDRPLQAFIGSSAFLLGLLAATATLVFPVMLRATSGDPLSLTAYNSSVPETNLRMALAWWPVAAVLAVGYLAALFRFHRGPVTSDASAH